MEILREVWRLQQLAGLRRSAKTTERLRSVYPLDDLRIIRELDPDLVPLNHKNNALPNLGRRRGLRVPNGGDCNVHATASNSREKNCTGLVPASSSTAAPAVPLGRVNTNYPDGTDE